MSHEEPNSISSFAVGVDGKLTLLDAKRTGNAVADRSGTAKALAYSPSHSTLFVLHAFGHDPSAADVGR